MIREIIIYSLVAFSSIFILGYSIHMLVGGLVSETVEWWLISGSCLIGIAVISILAWDIVKRRSRSSS